MCRRLKQLGSTRCYSSARIRTNYFKENDTGLCQVFQADDSRSLPSASTAMPVAKAKAKAKAATMGAVRMSPADGSGDG